MTRRAGIGGFQVGQLVADESSSKKGVVVGFRRGDDEFSDYVIVDWDGRDGQWAVRPWDLTVQS